MERRQRPGPGGPQGHRAGRPLAGRAGTGRPGRRRHRPHRRQRRRRGALPRRAARGRPGPAAQRGHRPRDEVPGVLPTAQARSGGPSPRAGRTSSCSAGAVVLSGKVDLTLGKLEPGRANKVIIDLKSGMPVASHREDLRFYALLETLRLGRAAPRCWPRTTSTRRGPSPRRSRSPCWRRPCCARWTASASWSSWPRGAQPVVRPGSPCRWCPIAADLRRRPGVAVGRRRARRARTVTTTVGWPRATPPPRPGRGATSGGPIGP